MNNELSFNLAKLNELYNQALDNLNKYKESLDSVKSEITKIGDNWISTDTGTYEAFKEKFEEKESRLNEAVTLMQEFVNILSLKINDYEAASQKVNNSFQ